METAIHCDSTLKYLLILLLNISLYTKFTHQNYIELFVYIIHVHYFFTQHLKYVSRTLCDQCSVCGFQVKHTIIISWSRLLSAHRRRSRGKRPVARVTRLLSRELQTDAFHRVPRLGTLQLLHERLLLLARHNRRLRNVQEASAHDSQSW